MLGQHPSRYIFRGGARTMQLTVFSDTVYAYKGQPGLVTIEFNGEGSDVELVKKKLFPRSGLQLELVQMPPNRQQGIVAEQLAPGEVWFFAARIPGETDFRAMKTVCCVRMPREREIFFVDRP